MSITHPPSRRIATGDGLFPEPWLGRLLLVSLLVMLNLPAIYTGTTGMDQYGFFTLEATAKPPWPLLLSILVSTAAALSGYVIYRLLRKRQTWFAGNRYEAYHRNAVLFGVPVGLAFTPAFFLTGYNDKPTVLAVAGVLATSLCITGALRDRETQLDPTMARIWFVVGVAFILVFLILGTAAMLVIFQIGPAPSSGNFFWSWKFAWSALGYPAEEFNQRHRNGLLAFTLAGSCYMTVAVGGAMLGEILGWTKPRPVEDYGHLAAEAALTDRPKTLADWMNHVQTAPQDSPEFLVAVDGEETAISRSQYANLLADKDQLLTDCRLLVDKAAGNAFARTSGQWKRLPFRGRRKGPFLLICVYARHPGRRFTTGELEALLKPDLSERDSINVSDFFAQLQRRNPPVPVQRDDDGTYIPESVKVCFLDHWPAPHD
jgi:hypothetical protein